MRAALGVALQGAPSAGGRKTHGGLLVDQAILHQLANALTGVCQRDLIDLRGVQPHAALADAQDAGREAVLQSKEASEKSGGWRGLQRGHSTASASPERARQQQQTNLELETAHGELRPERSASNCRAHSHRATGGPSARPAGAASLSKVPGRHRNSSCHPPHANARRSSAMRVRDCLGWCAAVGGAALGVGLPHRGEVACRPVPLNLRVALHGQVQAPRIRNRRPHGDEVKLHGLQTPPQRIMHDHHSWRTWAVAEGPVSHAGWREVTAVQQHTLSWCTRPPGRGTRCHRRLTTSHWRCGGRPGARRRTA